MPRTKMRWPAAAASAVLGALLMSLTQPDTGMAHAKLTNVSFGEPSPGITARDCRGVLAWPEANARRVRELGRISEDWVLQGVDPHDEGGARATLLLAMLACIGFELDGRARPVVYTSLSVLVDLPERVRDRATSNFAGISGETDFYLLSWTTNDAGLARWLNDGTGLDQWVRHAPDLRFEYTAVPDAEPNFTFAAPAPTPSPFDVTATVTEPVLPAYPVVSNFWAETRRGTVMIETSNPLGDRLGPAKWQLRTSTNSRLARMMGTTKAQGCNEFGTESTIAGRWRKDVPNG